jgi:hypothetical protein
MNTGSVIALGMILVFSITAAGLIWRLGRADWHLSFLTTVEASVNAGKYGHAVEHRAETMIVGLLMVSTAAALMAGAGIALVTKVASADKAHN